MKTLQLGYGKSGNYWLWNILTRMITCSGHPIASYVRDHPVYAFAKTLDLSFPEQADIDFLFVENSGLYLSVLPCVRMRIVDERDYFEKTSYVWSHSPYCRKMSDVCTSVDRRVYIIRDPRDIALSFAAFAKTSFHERFYGADNRALSIAANENLKFIAQRWVHHVVPYLRRRNELGLHVVFYEHLKNDFARACEGLERYFDLELTAMTRRRIEKRVSLGAMKKSSPGHVASGEIGRWRRVAPNIEADLDPRLAELLALLNYRRGANNVGYPELPPAGDPVLESLEREARAPQQGTH